MYKLVRTTNEPDVFASMFIGSSQETASRELQYTPEEWTHDFKTGLGITCFKSMEDIKVFLKAANDSILGGLLYGKIIVFTCKGRNHIRRKYIPATNHHTIGTFYLEGAEWTTQWKARKQKAPLGTRFFKELMLQEDVTEYFVKTHLATYL